MDGPDWEAIRKRVVSRHSKALEYLHKAEKEELMDEPQNCTPPEELQRQIMSHNEPKNEREWWACHRIEQLEAARDGAYTERNRLVALLATLFPSGTKKTAIPGWDEAWHGCVYIDLPNGQASWHYHDSEAHLFANLPPYQGDWDGHSTEEKYARIAALAEEKKDEQGS